MIVDDRLRTAEGHPAPAGSLPVPVRGDMPRQLTENRPAVTPAAPPVGGTQARVAIDRWVNEGGRIYDGDRTESRAPDAPGVRHLAPNGHGSCGDTLRCSPHMIDSMREHVAPGGRRQCLDLLDRAVC